MARRLDAVFLDRRHHQRQGARREYITAPAQLRLLPGAAEGIRMLNRAGVPVVVVTNQRGIALGLMDEADLTSIHSRLHQLLHDHDAQVDGIFHCPHDKGTCDCRKPGTLMLRRARDSLGLTTLRHCVMIGDSSSDIEAGRRAGARTVLLRGGEVAAQRVDVAPTLLDAVRRELDA